MEKLHYCSDGIRYLPSVTFGLPKEKTLVVPGHFFKKMEQSWVKLEEWGP